MEALFQEHVTELKERGLISTEHERFAELADKAAEEIYVNELDTYMKREVNVKAQFEVLKKYGLLGIHVPKQYAGLGGDAIALSLLFERLGQVGMGVVTGLDVQTCLTEAILQRWANEEQKKRYLVPEAKGDKFMSFCLTEPGEGSDPSSLQTTFEEKDGGFVINGEKYLITNGSIANAYIVFCRNKEKGISAIIVDKDDHVKKGSRNRGEARSVHIRHNAAEL